MLVIGEQMRQMMGSKSHSDPTLNVNK